MKLLLALGVHGSKLESVHPKLRKVFRVSFVLLCVMVCSI